MSDIQKSGQDKEDGTQQDVLKLALTRENLDKIELAYNTLKTDPALNKYESQIQILYNSLSLIQKNESTLFNNYNKLHKTYDEMSLKYSQAVKLAQKDINAKQDLKDELEKVWHHATNAKTKERKMLETVSSLKMEIYNLTKLVEQDKGISMGQENSLHELMKEKESIDIKNQKLIEDLRNIEEEFEKLKQNNLELVKMADESRAKETLASNELLVSTLEIQKLTRQIEQCQLEISAQNKLNKNKDVGLTRLNQALMDLKIESTKQDQSTKELELNIEKLRKDLDSQLFRNQKQQNEMEQLLILNDSFKFKNSELETQLKHKNSLIERRKFEYGQIQKIRDTLERKIRILEEEKTREQVEKEEIVTKMELLNKDLVTARAEKDAFKENSENLRVEKDRLNFELKILHGNIDAFKKEIKFLQIEILAIKNENNDLKSNENYSRKLKSQFDIEKNKLTTSLNSMQEKYQKSIEQVKIKDLVIGDLNKANSELKQEIVSMKQVYERALLNENSKRQFESKKEFKQFESKLEKAKNQEINLNKQIVEFKTSLTKVNGDLQRKETSLNRVRIKFDEKEKEIDVLKSNLKTFEFEEKKFIEKIKDSELRILKLEKVNRVLFHERNVIGTMLIRRNDEVYLLYEKIRILETILKRGEIAYAKLAESLRFRNLESTRLKKSLQLLEGNKSQIKALKSLLESSEKARMFEQAKRDVLEDDCGQKSLSVNIHRWRKLKGCDPTTYELVVKVSALQRRLIKKSEQLVFMEMKFQEKDRVFLELKQYFSRRLITEETDHVIFNYKHALNDANRKVKSLFAENKMLATFGEK